MAVDRVRQRQIIEVNYRFHDRMDPLPHPALVVSTDELQEKENGMFYAVLISSKNHHPEYTLEIKEEDLIGTNKLEKQSFYVTHMMSFFSRHDVLNNYNLFVKNERFNEVINKVIDSIFGPEQYNIGTIGFFQKKNGSRGWGAVFGVYFRSLDDLPRWRMM